MNDTITIAPIGHMRADFGEKFGIPRQSGIVPSITSTIVLEAKYATEDHVKGLEEFTHLWIIWGFSENGPTDKATVRPPRLGGNERLGVWATRSPFRPNPLGLSCVKIQSVRKEKGSMVIDVAGADLMDGTPIYDLKPYVPLADCRKDASGGFTDREAWKRLTVECADELLCLLPEDKRESLLGILAEDPRPAYQEDADRVYGMNYAGMNVSFRICKDVLTVLNVEKLA